MPRSIQFLLTRAKISSFNSVLLLAQHIAGAHRSSSCWWNDLVEVALIAAVNSPSGQQKEYNEYQKMCISWLARKEQLLREQEFAYSAITEK